MKGAVRSLARTTYSSSWVHWKDSVAVGAAADGAEGGAAEPLLGTSACRLMVSDILPLAASSLMISTALRWRNRVRGGRGVGEGWL